MGATRVLSSRTWRQNLSRRSYLVYFQIPSKIVHACRIRTNTKRRVAIRLSTGCSIIGVATISSGTELYIPAAVRAGFEKAKWFKCTIVGAAKFAKSDLMWARP
jgi:hypothetical protein